MRAAVKVEIHRGRGKDAINGLVVTTEIQGSRAAEHVELPDAIELRTPLYVGTAPVELELDLCVEADKDGEVSVLVTSGTLAEAKVQAFEAMVATIRAGLPAGAVLTLGAPQHEAWNYLPEMRPEGK